MLTFAGALKTDGQFRGLKVHALPLGIAVAVQDFIDDDMMQYYLYRGREYPAFLWSRDHDTYRDSVADLTPIFEARLMKCWGKAVSKRLETKEE